MLCLPLGKQPSHGVSQHLSPCIHSHLLAHWDPEGLKIWTRINLIYLHRKKSCRKHVTVVARGQKQPKIKSFSQRWFLLTWMPSFTFKLIKSLNKNESTCLNTVMQSCIIISVLKNKPKMSEMTFVYSLLRRSAFLGAESWELGAPEKPRFW